MADETTSLLKDKEPKNFYFLRKNQESESSGVTESLSPANNENSGGLSWLSRMLWEKKSLKESSKPRKIPVKIEPKVFFANERTFLAWLHMSITLATISMAIIAFAEANEWSKLYGIFLMPVAIAFCGYSLWMYMKRSAMIRRKDPGPYDERTGPIILASLLGVSIVVNFVVKLYEYAT